MYEDLAKDYDLDEVSLEILKAQGSKSQALKYLRRFPKKVAKKVAPKAAPKSAPKIEIKEEE
mgnify:FL=1